MLGAIILSDNITGNGGNLPHKHYIITTMKAWIIAIMQIHALFPLIAQYITIKPFLEMLVVSYTLYKV